AWIQKPRAILGQTKPNSFPNTNKIDTTELIMDFGSHSMIWIILVGLVIGAIGKLLMPGRDPGGCIVTFLLGIAGALVGTWVGRIFAGENYVAGWIMSIVGAMILLLLYRLLFKRKPAGGAGILRVAAGIVLADPVCRV